MSAKLYKKIPNQLPLYISGLFCLVVVGAIKIVWSEIEHGSHFGVISFLSCIEYLLFENIYQFNAIEKIVNKDNSLEAPVINWREKSIGSS